MVHHCNKCELVFETRSELVDHLDVDHVVDRSDATGPPGSGEAVTETVETGAGTGRGAPESLPDPPPSSSEARRGWLSRLLGRGRD